MLTKVYSDFRECFNQIEINSQLGLDLGQSFNYYYDNMVIKHGYWAKYFYSEALIYFSNKLTIYVEEILKHKLTYDSLLLGLLNSAQTFNYASFNMIIVRIDTIPPRTATNLLKILSNNGMYQCFVKVLPLITTLDKPLGVIEYLTIKDVKYLEALAKRRLDLPYTTLLNKINTLNKEGRYFLAKKYQIITDTLHDF